MGESGALALRPGDATGRLQPAAIAWRFQKNIPYIPAPVLYQNVFYMVKTGGIVTSLDAATGKLLKEGRTPGAPGEYYASPVAADGKVFIASTEGKVSVIRAAGEWEVLGVNDSGENPCRTRPERGARVWDPRRDNNLSSPRPNRRQREDLVPQSLHAR